MRTAFTLLLCLMTTPVIAGVSYSLTDLGVLPGGVAASRALGVNDRGQIVGFSGNPSRAFLWDAGVMMDLGTLPGPGESSSAWAINNSGQVSGTAANGNLNAFLWQLGTMSSLGSPLASSGALAINGFGDVAGYSVFGSGLAATIWSGETTTVLPTLTGKRHARAWGINDKGVAVGFSFDSSIDARATMWQSGISVDLGTLPSHRFAEAYDINQFNQVVGTSMFDFATQHAVIWESGSITSLGDGVARAINDSGEVVGRNNAGAFVWDEIRGMRSLDSLLDASGTGYHLSSAFDINASGQIVGDARTPSGASHAVLLTPSSGPIVPEPISILSFAMLAFVTSLRRRARPRRCHLNASRSIH